MCVCARNFLNPFDPIYIIYIYIYTHIMYVNSVQLLATRLHVLNPCFSLLADVDWHQTVYRGVMGRFLQDGDTQIRQSVRRGSYFFFMRNPMVLRVFRSAIFPFRQEPHAREGGQRGCVGTVSPWFSLGLLDLQSFELVDPLPYTLRQSNVAMDGFPMQRTFSD